MVAVFFCLCSLLFERAKRAVFRLFNLNLFGCLANNFFEFRQFNR